MALIRPVDPTDINLTLQNGIGPQPPTLMQR